jgi:cytochrome c oxidase assembly protein subunit 11
MSTESPNDSPPTAAARLRNLPMLGKLALFALMMFGFGFAMIPLYNAICEVTGINSLTDRDAGAEEFARSTQVDTSRSIVIEFDANRHGPWQFKPAVRSLEVHPGELATVEYELINTAAETKAGQAIPSYAPEIGGRYFRKLECFCFQQQTLASNETRRFPVVFVIDPKLPDEVNLITLSYTFFDVAGKVGKAPASAAPRAQQGRT